MSTQKILAAFLLLGFIVVAIVFETTGGFRLITGNLNDMTRGSIVGFSVGAACIFLLNIIGLWTRPKYFGGLGVIGSGAMLAYGLYVLITNKSFIPIPNKRLTLVGGVATGFGAAGLATSLGIITM